MVEVGVKEIVEVEVENIFAMSTGRLGGVLLSLEERVRGDKKLYMLKTSLLC